MVQGHGDFAVYVDSPLAAEATHIFNNTDTDSFDEETTALVRQGINPIGFDGLRISVTSDESKQINFIDTPKVIISASGMCEAGRIKHHLKHNLWRRECTVVFVGYQAAGTTGRALADGAKHVKILGEDIEVKAEIVQLEGISGHADQKRPFALAGRIAVRATAHIRRTRRGDGLRNVWAACAGQTRLPRFRTLYSECYDLNKMKCSGPATASKRPFTAKMRRRKAARTSGCARRNGVWRKLSDRIRAAQTRIWPNLRIRSSLCAKKWKRAQN